MKTYVRCQQIKVDDKDSYVYDLNISCDFSVIASSLSDNCVNIYDASRFPYSQLTTIYLAENVNSIEFSSNSPYLLNVASNKSVSFWDTRNPTQSVLTFNTLNVATSSSLCTTNDALLAVACENEVLFYDSRFPSSNEFLGKYEDCHNDSITTVKFAKDKSNILFSAGEDGLICSYNTAVSASEDPVISIINCESVIKRFGQFGPSNEGLYCITHAEQFSMWHFPSAQRLVNYPDIRNDLGLDLLVDCWTEERSGIVHLLGSSFEGTGYVLHVEPGGVTNICQLQGGHTSSIRSLLHLPTQGSGSNGMDTDTSKLLLGGEDGFISVWKQDDTSSSSSMVSRSASSSTNSAIPSHSLVSRTSHQRARNLRYTPY